jgi:phage terminase small subunit
VTPKQQRFVAEYLVDLNAAAAAVRAGYSKRSAMQLGSRLLQDRAVSAAISKGKASQLKAAGLSAEKVLEAIRRPIEADIRKMFDEDGNVRPLHELGPEEASLIIGHEVIIKNAKAGDKHTDEVLRVRLVDRAKYVEMAAKHFALLTERVEHTGGLDIHWKSSE